MSRATTMTPARRLTIYDRAGRVYLTARQERRYIQKWRKYMNCADGEDYSRKYGINSEWKVYE